MSKIDDIAVFVRVVQVGGLAAAGRQLGLSPASMTARINALEQRHDTRLLQRTTRSISLTEAGQRYYDAGLRVLDELEYAEALLQNDDVCLSGQLRMTAPSDFGRQYVVPVLAEFLQLHPKVRAYLHLTDSVENLVEQRYDLGIRFGNLPDSTLIVKSLAENHRVLVASPAYLEQQGIPAEPNDLQQHRCLVLERLGEPLNEWLFHDEQGEKQMVKVPAGLTSNDGAVIRSWTLAGMGIAFKSFWDVKSDIAAGTLQTILDEFVVGFQQSDRAKTGLQFVYPNRKYMPAQVTSFMSFFKSRLLEVS